MSLPPRNHAERRAGVPRDRPIDTSPLAVAGAGVLCPIGLDAGMALGSFNAGIVRKQESLLTDRDLEPIVLGFLPDDVLPNLSDGLAGAELTDLQKRLLRYGGPALQQACVACKAVARVPLLLAAPVEPPPSEPVIGREFLDHLAVQSQIRWALDDSAVIATGHAGAFEALNRARTEFLVPGRARYVLVGGVDSFYDEARLDRLRSENRLLVEGVTDGFTPGEGAGFLLLSTLATCRRDGIQPVALIEAVGLGAEMGHRYALDPYTGDGLATAFAAALAESSALAPGRLISTVLAGFNGEGFHAKEWGVAFLRHSEHFADDLRFEHPAEYTGDMGTGLAPIMLALAAMGLRERTIEGPVMVWASSDGPERGAAVVSRAPDEA